MSTSSFPRYLPVTLELPSSAFPATLDIDFDLSMFDVEPNSTPAAAAGAAAAAPSTEHTTVDAALKPILLPSLPKHTPDSNTSTNVRQPLFDSINLLGSSPSTTAPPNHPTPSSTTPTSSPPPLTRSISLPVTRKPFPSFSNAFKPSPLNESAKPVVSDDDNDLSSAARPSLPPPIPPARDWSDEPQCPYTATTCPLLAPFGTFSPVEYNAPSSYGDNTQTQQVAFRPRNGVTMPNVASPYSGYDVRGTQSSRNTSSHQQQGSLEFKPSPSNCAEMHSRQAAHAASTRAPSISPRARSQVPQQHHTFTQENYFPRVTSPTEQQSEPSQRYPQQLLHQPSQFVNAAPSNSQQQQPTSSSSYTQHPISFKSSYDHSNVRNTSYGASSSSTASTHSGLPSPSGFDATLNPSHAPGMRNPALNGAMMLDIEDLGAYEKACLSSASSNTTGTQQQQPSQQQNTVSLRDVRDVAQSPDDGIHLKTEEPLSGAFGDGWNRPQTVGDAIDGGFRGSTSPDMLSSGLAGGYMHHQPPPPPPQMQQQHVSGAPDGTESDGEQTAFVSKLWHLLTHSEYQRYLRWSKDGDSFILMNGNEFAINVLPRFFRHSNVASFVRQLNLYSFQRVSTIRLLDMADPETSTSIVPGHQEHHLDGHHHLGEPSYSSGPSESPSPPHYGGGHSVMDQQHQYMNNSGHHDEHHGGQQQDEHGHGPMVAASGFTHPYFKRSRPDLLKYLKPKNARKPNGGVTGKKNAMAVNNARKARAGK